MDITIKTASPDKLRTGVLVVGAFADGALPAATGAIDEASKGKVSAILKRGDLEAKAGAALLVPDLPGVAAERVLLVSLGTARASSATGRSATPSPVRQGALPAARPRTRRWPLPMSTCPVARSAGAGAGRVACSPTAPTASTPGRPPGSASRESERGARAVALLVSGQVTPEVERAVRRGRAVAEGMALGKDLGNLGGNVCNPAFMAQTAQALGREFKFAVEVLERDDMEKLGMGSALSVGRASHLPVQVHRHALPGRRRRPGRSSWWARASPSTPAASPSSPAPIWTR